VKLSEEEIQNLSPMRRPIVNKPLGIAYGTGEWCWPSSASKRNESNYENLRCHRKLGLGTRFRNIWNGRWWVHVRFCSIRCEGIYEVKRNDAAKQRWHAFLARGNSRS
jgi:hypothetical protein